jgi:hypothetical protein
VAVLAEMSGLDADKSEELLTRAFGWGSQVYWRKEKLNEVPDPKQASLPALSNNVSSLALTLTPLLPLTHSAPPTGR